MPNASEPDPAAAARALRKRLCLVVAFVLATPCAGAGELVFGMSTALSGPAAELGKNMKAGVEAAFHEANAADGVRGLPLRLVALDDGYEPSETAPNMYELINDHRVLAVIGNVGTPTAVVAAPIAIENKTLFFGAFTGAGVLRKDPPDRYVINYRASYAEETGAMVDALVNQAGIAPNEIAFFTQRDAYGDAGYTGGVEALLRNGLTSEVAVAHGRYERNTDAVESGLAEVLLAEPPARAVIMVGAYKPCAAFIRLARESGVDAIFLNVSFVGSEPLRRSLGEQTDGVFVTQVVPHFMSSAPIVERYHKALGELDKSISPSFGSLEGYIAARVLLEGLRGVEGPIDRESIIDAMESLGEFEIGLDKPLTLTPQEHQASHLVWPTRVRPSGVEPFDWTSLRGASRP